MCRKPSLLSRGYLLFFRSVVVFRSSWSCNGADLEREVETSAFLTVNSESDKGFHRPGSLHRRSRLIRLGNTLLCAQLGSRMCHVLRRIMPIAMYLLQVSP